MNFDGATLNADDHEQPDMVPKAAQTKLVLATEMRLLVIVMIFIVISTMDSR
jgi:hypothetical protein